MLFYCETCLATGEKSYVLWIAHLLSASHQCNTKDALLDWSTEQNEKSWVIFSSSKETSKLDDAVTLEELTSYFSKFGVIGDLYMDTNRRFAVVQIDPPTMHSNNDVPSLREGTHDLAGIRVKLLKKGGILEQSWLDLGISKASLSQEKVEPCSGESLTKISKKGDYQDSPFVTPLSANGNSLPPQVSARKKRNRNRDESQILPSPTPSYSNVLFPQTKGTPVFPHSKTMTFYNKNALPVAVGTSHSPAKMESLNKKAKNKGHSQKQAQNQPLVNNHVAINDFNKLPSYSPLQPFPVVKDYFSLFDELRLPELSVQQRLNIKQYKQYKEFQSLDLDQQLVCFMYAITMTAEDRSKRDMVLSELVVILHQKFPKCILYPFGSMSTGLGDHFSDIDIYVDIFGETTGVHPNPYEGRRTKQDIMMEIKRLLKKARYPNTRTIYGKVIPVLSARVPILKFSHASTQISVDLSFENLLSFQNTKMISFLMTLDDRVRPLLLIVRYWGKFHNITGSTLIKNYALTLLVLVFLSRKKIIPTMQQLQSLAETSFVVDGWNAAFCEDGTKVLSEFKKDSLCDRGSTSPPTTASILQLAQEFFDVYANTDFSKAMICSLTGEEMPKEHFFPGNEEILPEALELYKSWSARQSVVHRLKVSTNLVIQDPFLLSFNVGGVTTEGTLVRFQVACVQTAKILKENPKCIVDVFVELPKQVGEKVFMAKQKIHKKHLSLRQEIKKVLNCIEEKSDTIEDLTPVHFRPIDQIISKKTIQYGHGWESFIHYFLSDGSRTPFQKLFDSEVRSLIDKELTKQTEAESKLRTIWIMFVKQFLTEVWPICFGLKVNEMEEVMKPERRFADVTGNERKKRKKTKSELENENPTTEISDHDHKSPSHNEDEAIVIPKDRSTEENRVLLGKLNSVKDPEYGIYYYRMNCSATTPFWIKRDFYRKQSIKIIARGDTSRDESLDASSSLKESKKNSKGLKKKRNKNLLDKVFDPFTVEEKVMSLIAANLETSSNSEQGSLETVFQFTCWVKLDVSCINGGPEIFFIFEKDPKGHTTNYSMGASVVASSFKKLLPDYMLFKLASWLGLVPTTERTTEVAAPDSELCFTFSDSETEQNKDDNCEDDEIDDCEINQLTFENGDDDQ